MVYHDFLPENVIVRMLLVNTFTLKCPQISFMGIRFTGQTFATQFLQFLQDDINKYPNVKHKKILYLNAKHAIDMYCTYKLQL